MGVDRRIYGPEWPNVRAAVLERAGHRCEVCGAPAGLPHPATGKIVRLQIAHLNHNRADHRMSNVKAMCPRDHALHDAAMHGRVRRWRKERGQGVLFEMLRRRER